MKEKTKKIMIIDDEKDFADMVKLNLADTGEYQVKVETRGANALAAVKKFKPDLIFLDIMMPDLDGGTVFYNLRNDRATRDIPVVFLTAIVNEDEVRSVGSVISGRPFLAKPISTDKLIECIKKIIK